MDRLRAMSVFLAVADEGGFAAAGRRLGLSAPSVTRMVSELEEALGARLFHRTTRTVRLTPAGIRYLEDCRRILADVEEADRQAGGLHQAPKGRVSVTGSALFGRLVVTPLIFEAMDRFPEISISTFFVDRIVHMVDEGFDVAVRIAHLPDSSLAAAKVGTVRRVLCASPDYLAQRGEPDTPAALADHSCVEFSAMMASGLWDFEKDGRSLAHRPDARLRVNTADAAIAAVLDGRGITRVLSYMIADHVRAGALKVILDDFEVPPVPVHVVHKEAGQASGRVRAVVDHLVERLRASPALDHD
ncbi:MAG: LysR family transcriptional regulator [Parvibaculaceae bacterium]